MFTVTVDGVSKDWAQWLYAMIDAGNRSNDYQTNVTIEYTVEEDND